MNDLNWPPFSGVLLWRWLPVVCRFALCDFALQRLKRRKQKRLLTGKHSDGARKRLFPAFQRPEYSLGIQNQVDLKTNRAINSTVRTLMNSSPIHSDVISISKRHSGHFSPPSWSRTGREHLKAASTLDAAASTAPGWRRVFVSVSVCGHSWTQSNQVSVLE